MSAPIIQGWCPGALRPMLSGDGYVVRIRPPGGRLTQEQAAGIAWLAAQHGNGVIDLSNRANVQLRGVTEASHGPLMTALRSLVLLDADTAAESRRNIVEAPFWVAGDQTDVLARALADVLARDDAPSLPGKFGFAVDCGHVPVLRQISADIRFERAADQMADQVIVRADGAAAGAAVAPQHAIAIALDLARWFVATGGVQDGRGRMATHLARGAQLPDLFHAVPVQALDAPDIGPGLVAQGALVGFAFGQMRAETLAALAKIGPLRVTPWRMLLIENAAAMPDLPGLIISPEDPLRRVIACTGSPGCLQAHAAVRPLAHALAVHVPPGKTLHVSGCAKGCANPGKADYTLVAQEKGFGLIHAGAAAQTPQHILTGAALSSNPQRLFGTP